MLRRSLSESVDHFWWPSEFENVANPDFENLKHLQNTGHLSLTASSIPGIVKKKMSKASIILNKSEVTLYPGNKIN